MQISVVVHGKNAFGGYEQQITARLDQQRAWGLTIVRCCLRWMEKATCEVQSPCHADSHDAAASGAAEQGLAHAKNAAPVSGSMDMSSSPMTETMDTCRTKHTSRGAALFPCSLTRPYWRTDVRSNAIQSLSWNTQQAMLHVSSEPITNQWRCSKRDIVETMDPCFY